MDFFWGEGKIVVAGLPCIICWPALTTCWPNLRWICTAGLHLYLYLQLPWVVFGWGWFFIACCCNKDVIYCLRNIENTQKGTLKSVRQICRHFNWLVTSTYSHNHDSMMWPDIKNSGAFHVWNWKWIHAVRIFETEQQVFVWAIKCLTT